jgi:hypothetical protein
LGHGSLGYGCGARGSQPGQYRDPFNGVTGLDGLPNHQPSTSSTPSTPGRRPQERHCLPQPRHRRQPTRPATSALVAVVILGPAAHGIQAVFGPTATLFKTPRPPSRSQPQDCRPWALVPPAPRPALKTRSPCTLHGLDRARLGSLGCTRLWPRAPLAMRRPPSEEVPPQGHG